MTVNKPVFILVRPQMGENIGAAARAMANFGLRELRIVAPRDGWPNEAATANASGAFEEMDEVKVYGTLAAASADLNYLFATTARERVMAKPVFTPAAAIEETLKKSGQKIGFVFGPERTGLENDEIVLCQGVVTIPTSPVFASLNLAQTALLIAYEYIRAANNRPAHVPAQDTPATQDKLDEMFTRLQSELEAHQFFKTEELKPTMLRNIRTMFMRGEWSEQEVRTFHGILSALTGKK
jgi:tRNA/rRNA methyltransferase